MSKAAQKGKTGRRATKNKRWVSQVKTVSTYPPAKTFTGSAEEIARTMARKDVSPKGLGSAVRMIQYFINRSGKNLPAERRRNLEGAKKILQKRMAEEKKAKTERKKQSTS
jgi:Protein of unknown function (DUF3175)